MLFLLMLVSVILSSAMIAVWVFLFFRYKPRFQGMLDGIDGSIFTLKEVYFTGLGCIDLYEAATRNKITARPKAVEKIKYLAEVFGRDDAELYYYITSAAEFSLILTFVPLGLLLGCMIGSYIGFLCGVLLAFAVIYGLRSEINSMVEKKKDSISSEFPRMVSKMTMLINAGMLVRRAWDEVANSNTEETLYAEMRAASEDIRQGMTLEDAMESFASRCGVKEIRKFASIYVQTVKLGPYETIDSMKAMAEESWELKKQISRQKGEIASQKLLIPNMIMLFGIIAVVVVPIIASMLGSI